MRELERDLPTKATLAPPALAILGSGRVGGSLARAAKAADLSVEVAGRDEAVGAATTADAALLCVPDSAIASLATQIASAGPPRLVGHTSGATSLAALAACAERGAATFSLHPLQTVPDAHTDLTGAPCAVTGSDSDALTFARELAEQLGMRPFDLADEQRAAYHAAAAIASNFLVALETSAAQLLERAGVADARDKLAPLVLRSAANWAERGEAALTGPIARGDNATVARHLEALNEVAPELVAMYEALAERARQIAADAEDDR
jgi:predicted short-subunit dehydrogenase-like oxidoreductase (DUF2520 family)